jgi:uncharacterized membrane protein YgdD (TMEM256/DUF423 family)
MDRSSVGVGAISAYAAVAFGAFGAHGLRDRISSEMLAIWHTGVEYHLAHSLALILVGILARDVKGPALRWAGRFFAIGIVLFAGSLYLLAVTGKTWFGAITPLGGVGFLAGWGCLAWGVYREGPG